MGQGKEGRRQCLGDGTGEGGATTPGPWSWRGSREGGGGAGEAGQGKEGRLCRGLGAGTGEEGR